MKAVFDLPTLKMFSYSSEEVYYGKHDRCHGTFTKEIINQKVGAKQSVNSIGYLLYDGSLIDDNYQAIDPIIINLVQYKIDNQKYSNNSSPLIY